MYVLNRAAELILEIFIVFKIVEWKVLNYELFLMIKFKIFIDKHLNN